MSVWAKKWAYEQRTGQAGAKAVLVALAEFADEDGYCYPSQRTLAAMTEIAERTVRTHLAYLEEKAFIKREGARAAGGKFTSDDYKLLAPSEALKPPAPRDASQRPNQPAAKSAVGRNRHSQRPNQPAAKSAAKPLIESDEPSEEPSEARGAGAPAAPHTPAGGSAPKTQPVAPRAAGPPTDFTVLGYLQYLARQPAYDHVDPAVEASKVRLWHEKPPNRERRITARFLDKWVDRIERPLKLGDSPPPKRKVADPAEQKRLEEKYRGRPTA